MASSAVAMLPYPVNTTMLVARSRLTSVRMTSRPDAPCRRRSTRAYSGGSRRARSAAAWASPASRTSNSRSRKARAMRPRSTGSSSTISRLRATLGSSAMALRGGASAVSDLDLRPRSMAGTGFDAKAAAHLLAEGPRDEHAEAQALSGGFRREEGFADPCQHVGGHARPRIMNRHAEARLAGLDRESNRAVGSLEGVAQEVVRHLEERGARQADGIAVALGANVEASSLVDGQT